MTSVGLILLIFAFVFAVIAALWAPQPQPANPYWMRVNFGWLALAFLIAAMIFGGLKL